MSTYALYHVPDPASAVDELARVVADDGTVALMTNGPGHLAEIERVRVEVLGTAAVWGINRAFSPDVALPLLADRFDEVAWYRSVEKSEASNPAPRPRHETVGEAA